jgi:hypothetical protein
VSLLASDPTMRSIRRRLRTAIDGRVITPGDAGYDRARSIFYGMFDRRPAVIVRPADPRDVSQVVLQRTAWAQTGVTGSPVPHIPPLIYGGVVAAVALLGWLPTVVPTRVALRAAPAEAIGMRE